MGQLRAFSLIEFIGVLAVLAIVAAALLPVVIRRIDRAAYAKESTDLVAISDALNLQILRDKVVPSDTTWAQATANWTMRPVTNITTTPRGFSRAFLLDTSGWLGSTTLPYTQTSNGIPNAPTNARVLLVSTIARGLPTLSSRPSLTDFNDIWNTPAGCKPSSWTTNWAGTGDDLLIQRINLQPMFHRLILVSRDTNTAARFSIDSSNLTDRITVPLGGLGWSSYYLDGTVVGLYSNATLQTKHVLKDDISFVFEKGAWAGQINTGPPLTNTLASEFSRTAADFFKSAWNANQSHASAQYNQSGVLAAMVNFMLDWTLWANQQPTHFYRYGEKDLSKVQIWTLIANEAAGVSDTATTGGTLRDYTSDKTGILQH